MDKHLEFIDGQWCVVDHATGEYTGGKTITSINPSEELVSEEQFGSQVYIESFTPLRKQLDQLSQQYRQLDMKIQALNFTHELIEQ